MGRAAVDFWYEFASTYSYPAAMVVEERAKIYEVDLNWRPFLLGPIFKDQGWDDSPFNIYPAKGRYMWRDLERICETRALPFRKPDRFPQNGLLGARVALSLEGRDRMMFTRALFTSQFAHGRDIGEEQVVADAIAAAGCDPAATFERALSTPNRKALRDATDEARHRGIFGAPSFIVGGQELFWGHDRMEDAFIWAAAMNEGL